MFSSRALMGILLLVSFTGTAKAKDVYECQLTTPDKAVEFEVPIDKHDPTLILQGDFQVYFTTPPCPIIWITHLPTQDKSFWSGPDDIKQIETALVKSGQEASVRCWIK